MKQSDTILLVENIEKSCGFYKEVMGLEVLYDWKSMVVFKNRLALHQANLLQPQNVIGPILKEGSQGSGNVIIYLEHENIGESYENLKNKGVVIIHGIIELPWGKIFRVYDPDNYIIEIGQSVDEKK